MKNLREYDPESKAPDLILLKRLSSFARPYSKTMLIALLLIIMSTLTDLAIPYITKIGIDTYINPYKNIEGVPYYLISKEHLEEVKQNYPVLYHSLKNELKIENNTYLLEQKFIHSLNTDDLSRLRNYDLSNITKISLLFLIMIITNFLLNYGHVILLSIASQKIIYDLRITIFSHLQALPFSFFDKNPVGRLVTRVTNDTDAIQEMFSNVIITIIKDLLLVVGIITIMFILNTTLAIVSISLFPILIILTIAFRLKAREIYRNVRTLLARINAYLAENISGMKIIQLFLREEENLERFKNINNLYFQSTIRNLKLNSVYRPAINALSSFALALIVYYGGREFLKNKIEIGMLFLFFSYVQTLFRPIQDIAEKYDLLQSAMASTERVVGLLNEPISITNSGNPIGLDSAKGTIEFKNVWFSYNNDEWVLKNVSFKIHPGESVGFVGATGAGKTSIINLLCRFYEAQKGEILIDGINIKNLTLKDLRKNIAVIFQDVFLFATDIKENIRLNNRDISDEEVQEAARKVQAHLFIEELPYKYDERMEERGITLSSGQRQLISFARALVFNPRILVLDEATSNVDSATEALINDAMKVVIKGRTSILIAHRLSTLESVNKIIILSNGKVVEMGTHAELIAKKGFYYHFYNVQKLD